MSEFIPHASRCEAEERANLHFVRTQAGLKADSTIKH